MRLPTSHTRSASRSNGFGSGRLGRWTRCSSSLPSAGRALLVLGPEPSRIRRRALRKAERRIREEVECLVWLPE